MQTYARTAAERGRAAGAGAGRSAHQTAADASPRVAQLRAMAARANGGPAAQRVRVRDSRDGQAYETDEMQDQEIVGLALQFYQLRNMGELQRIREAHPRLAIADGDLYQQAYGDPHPRTRKRHHLSDGESDNDDPRVAYRSLRTDEDPRDGLRPPEDHDPAITATAHVTSGTRAKKRSRFISLSRSKKVAGAWASKNRHRVVKVDLPRGSGVLDITRRSGRNAVFPSGSGSGLNTAKASQEVLSSKPVAPWRIAALYESEPLTVTEYDRRKTEGTRPGEELFRSRRTTRERPSAFALHEVYNREAASAARLERARAYWDRAVANVVGQVNARLDGTPGAEPVDADDVVAFLEERTHNAHRLDFIENDQELETYLAQIDKAAAEYVESRTE